MISSDDIACFSLEYLNSLGKALVMNMKDYLVFQHAKKERRKARFIGTLAATSTLPASLPSHIEKVLKYL